MTISTYIYNLGGHPLTFETYIFHDGMLNMHAHLQMKNIEVKRVKPPVLKQLLVHVGVYYLMSSCKLELVKFVQTVVQMKLPSCQKYSKGVLG